MANSKAYLDLLLEEFALPSNSFKNNLKYACESRVFQNSSKSNEVTDVISRINSKLHASGNDRSRALLLLETFLTQCPPDLFGEYLDGWMQQCSKGNHRTIDHELRILRKLIEKSVSNPGAKNHLIANALRQFAERLPSLEKMHKSVQTVIYALQCLRSFIQCYSSSSGIHRGIFQKYVMYCLAEHRKNEAIVHEAAACFVALCECGSKGQQGINFKEAWSSKFSLLINTCQKLLDSLYDNVDVVGLVAVEQVTEYLPELIDVGVEPEVTPMERYHQLMDRFVVVAELLQAMLLCKYSTNKSLRPNDILNLTNRVLSMTGSILGKSVQTNDILSLACITPELHERSLDILAALITSVKRNLIPYGTAICRQGLQSLKWTHSNDWAYGSQKPYQSLRCKVYSLLSSWMSVAGTSSSIEFFADDLIPIIIADIEFVKPSVKLIVSTTASKKHKSRKRGHLVTEMNMQSDTTGFIDEKANMNVCIVAHKVLQSLLRCASVLIKWEHHKHLQCVILPLLTKIFNSLSSSSYPLPYLNNECRQQLFASLLSLVQEPHPKWTSPLSLAIRFLSRGTHDENSEVASFCRMSLCQLESTIHPRCPTMYESQIESTAQPRCPTLHENREESTSEGKTNLSTLVQAKAAVERAQESARAVDNYVSTRVTFQEVLEPLAKKSKANTSTSTLVEEQEVIESHAEKSKSLPTKADDSGKFTVMLNDFVDTGSVDMSPSTPPVEGQEVVEPCVKKSKVDTSKSKSAISVEACTKKSKISLAKTVDKETADTMLNDFVNA